MANVLRVAYYAKLLAKHFHYPVTKKMNYGHLAYRECDGRTGCSESNDSVKNRKKNCFVCWKRH